MLPTDFSEEKPFGTVLRKLEKLNARAQHRDCLHDSDEDCGSSAGLSQTSKQKASKKLSQAQLKNSKNHLPTLNQKVIERVAAARDPEQMMHINKVQVAGRPGRPAKHGHLDVKGAVKSIKIGQNTAAL